MPEEALQAAFEIKTACDEISRRLLRWHWEHKPGAHSLGALLDHVAQRQQESPDYYDRMPDLSGKNSWQQLGTALSFFQERNTAFTASSSCSFGFCGKSRPVSESTSSL